MALVAGIKRSENNLALLICRKQLYPQSRVFEACRIEEVQILILTLQMACTHMATMGVLTRFEGGFAAERRTEVFASASTKLMRTFVSQVEALRRLRQGGSQFVRVEHVHVNEGGQAIIGNVTPGNKKKMAAMKAHRDCCLKGQSQWRKHNPHSRRGRPAAPAARRTLPQQNIRVAERRLSGELDDVFGGAPCRYIDRSGGQWERNALTYCVSGRRRGKGECHGPLRSHYADRPRLVLGSCGPKWIARGIVDSHAKAQAEADKVLPANQGPI